ncbi:MAG: mechanosensitive ion channel family protein [Alphaproteobacteria bacterium]|nr:mechanosensitive ion channel family protein [Alphaproteobacteria bacterium]
MRRRPADARDWPMAPAAAARSLVLAALLTLGLVLGLLAAAPAGAQLPLDLAGRGGSAAPATLPETLTPEQASALLARLSDHQVRELLLAQLQRGAAAKARERGAAQPITDVYLATLRQNLALVLRAVAALPGEAVALRDNLVAGVDGQLLSLAMKLLIMLSGAYAVGEFVAWACERLRKRLAGAAAGAAADGEPNVLGAAIMVMLVDALAVVAFLAAAGVLATITRPSTVVAERASLAVLSAAAILLLAALGSRFLLAPQTPSLRLLPISDRTARFLHGWVCAFALLVGAGWMTLDLALDLGMSEDVNFTLRAAYGFVLALSACAALWHARAALAGGAGATAPLAGSVFAVAFWFVWAMNLLVKDHTALDAYWIVFVAAGLVPLLDWLVPPWLAARFVPAAPPGADAELAEEAVARRRSFVPAIRRTLRAAMLTAVLVAVASLWGLDVIDNPAGRGFFSTAVTLLLGYAAWSLTKALIDPRLKERPVMAGDEEEKQALTRAETLLPLLRNTILVVLVVMVALIALSAIGVDIGPLLAGAGIVGIAVGFGAQALVRDIVSGVFFLVDDAFRVGEYVEMGALRGEVERISLRSMRLRHHRGAIHTVPFGELRSITNYDRDWVIEKMNFRLQYDADLEKVRKLVKKVGQEMLADPEHGPRFIEPLKSQGVHQMEESALILRVKFMCRPRAQFVLRREAFRRIKQAFEAAGIEFAHRKVAVVVPAGAANGAAAAAEAMLAAEGPPRPVADAR